MNLIDVHCHLNHEKFKNDLDEVLQRAKKAGLKAVIISGVNPASNRDVLKLAEKYQAAEKYPAIKVSLGIYPIDALGLSEGETGLPRQTEAVNLADEFQFIEENKDKITAIGEVGMDFYWDKEHHQEQKDNFRKIIRLAKRIKKPLVIHSRKAELECLELLEEELPQKEVAVNLHCFSGNKKLIKRGIEWGYYFSIPPIIIKLEHFQLIAKIVPLTQLLTETDAPWLSPFPDRKNEPVFVLETVKKIAEIKGISVEEAAEQIWKNYVKVFG